MQEIEFDPVDVAAAGALGEPGHRVFMIQGQKENARVAVVVEKQQVELLSAQSLEFLDSLSEDFPDEDIATPVDFDRAGEVIEVEPLFRARSMGLIFDPETQLVTLELRELPFESDIDDETFSQYSPVPEVHDDEKVVRLTMTRTQLRAMAVRGNESVNAGREPCPLCLGPMDLSGHICPRLN